jgi:hypothetical protein
MGEENGGSGFRLLESERARQGSGSAARARAAGGYAARGCSLVVALGRRGGTEKREGVGGARLAQGSFFFSFLFV